MMEARLHFRWWLCAPNRQTLMQTTWQLTVLPLYERSCLGRLADNEGFTRRVLANHFAPVLFFNETITSCVDEGTRFSATFCTNHGQMLPRFTVLQRRFYSHLEHWNQLIKIYALETMYQQLVARSSGEMIRVKQIVPSNHHCFCPVEGFWFIVWNNWITFDRSVTPNINGHQYEVW
jgi:hypothetical protein